MCILKCVEYKLYKTRIEPSKKIFTLKDNTLANILLKVLISLSKYDTMRLKIALKTYPCMHVFLTIYIIVKNIPMILTIITQRVKESVRVMQLNLENVSSNPKIRSSRKPPLYEAYQRPKSHNCTDI